MQKIENIKGKHLKEIRFYRIIFINQLKLSCQEYLRIGRPQ